MARRYDWWRGRGRYYGDSAIFVRAEVYREIGGIRPLALMEDYDFARRLERRGRTCWISKAPVVTSARRFVGRPVAAVLAGWIAVHLLYWIGIAPERLARLYRSESTEPASPPA